jgi:hypothetical protein
MALNNSGGIFELFFREAGDFWAKTWEYAEQKGREDDAADLTIRRQEAEARLLEQVRLAKEAGIDVEAVLAAARKDA